MKSLKYIAVPFLVLIALAGIIIANVSSPTMAQSNLPPPVTNIQHSGQISSSGEVVISWDLVPQATYYRIGYVNMKEDYLLAKANCTGDWLEAFVYVDVNAQNIVINSDGRAEYTLRRLSPGVHHAFTVLTSNDFNNTIEQVSGTFVWPEVPRWVHLNRQPTETLPSREDCPPDPVAENRAALVALYNATGGPDWANNSGWATDAPLREWHGITTDNIGRVTQLHLPNNGLTGEIPSEMGNLTNLEWLDLSENHLTGEIPAELANLSILRALRLWDNQLTGPVPAWLGSLSSLEELVLSENNLTGPIPAELASLSNLKYLNLWGNELSGSVPTRLGSLTNLEWLILSNNGLTGTIPSSLGDLSNLSALNLGGNELEGTIPAELASLSNLRFLSLWGNELSGPVPAWLSDMTNLEGLWLDYNQLTGPIPPELGNLSKLEWLSLQNNQLTGDIPSALGNLTKLESLWLSGNQLTGCVPAALQGVADNDFALLGLPFCGN